MMKFTRKDLHGYLNKKENIRNFSVIAEFDSIKLALTDSLVAAVSIPGYTLTSRGKPMGSSALPFYYEMTDGDLKADKGKRSAYFFNLIDLPGPDEFSSDVTASLRITDGALVVVDCIKGVSVRTETLLHQALGERIRPVLTLDGMNNCFLGVEVDGEEAYTTFQNSIEHANAIIATFKDPLLGDVQVYPEKGAVAFSAGRHGWAFTLTSFAKMYASKFGFDESESMERLWGENFFDSATKKWTTKNSGSPTCKRGFVQFCYDPIKQIINICMNGDKDKLWPILTKLGVLLEPEEKSLVGEKLMERVMQTWLPAGSALFEMMMHHLPSPATAQKYRVENLYKGPMDDQYATAIRNCDPDGPLLLYVSKMIQPYGTNILVAFGRVFAGKVSDGAKVRIMGPDYVPGEVKDLCIRNVKKVSIFIGRQSVDGEVVPCGNIVYLYGLGPSIKKCVTLTNEKEVDAHPIRAKWRRFFCWFCGKTSNSQHVILQHASVRHPDIPYIYCGDKSCQRPLFVEDNSHFHHYANEDEGFDDDSDEEDGYDAAYEIPFRLVRHETDDDEELNADKMGGW